MGVKSSNYQVGTSATNTQNFNIRTGLDGTLRIYRGSDTSELSEVLTINADGTVTGDIIAGVGVGQAWQDVTGSRAANTTYTNSTGRPILVLVGFSVVSGGTVTYLVNGVTIAYHSPIDVGDTVPVSLIVPAGATYRCNTTSTLNRWSELR